MLEEAESAGSSGKEVSPLHSDQGEEITEISGGSIVPSDPSQWLEACCVRGRDSHGLSDVDGFGVCIWVVGSRQTTIAESTAVSRALTPICKEGEHSNDLQVTEFETFPIQIPESHSRRAQALQHTEEEVRMAKQLPIDQSIFLDITRFASQDPRFGFLEAE